VYNETHIWSRGGGVTTHFVKRDKMTQFHSIDVVARNMESIMNTWPNYISPNKIPHRGEPHYFLSPQIRLLLLISLQTFETPLQTYFCSYERKSIFLFYIRSTSLASFPAGLPAINYHRAKLKPLLQPNLPNSFPYFHFQLPILFVLYREKPLDWNNQQKVSSFLYFFLLVSH